MFQSLTGRLQTSERAGYGVSVRGFNPSQVGYKPVLRVSWRVRLGVFQSLTGRLQTDQHRDARAAQTLFQSLTGRLQTRSWWLVKILL